MKSTLKSSVLGLCVMLLCMGWCAISVEASVVLHLSDQQMTLRAGRIVRGKVVRKYSKWVKAERRIYTYVTIAVLDMIKGSKEPQEVVIRQVGGTANGLGMHVPGSAQFRLGEEVLVFLEKARTSNHHMVMGMSFGKYRVVLNPTNQMRYLERDLHGVSLAQYNEQKKLQIKHATPEMLRPKPMNTFVQQLRGYLANAPTQTPQVRPVMPRLVKPRPAPRLVDPRPAPARPAPRTTK